MIEPPKELVNSFDNFMDICDRNVEKHPYIIVVLMHEFFRHLYPSDPFIPLRTDTHTISQVQVVINRNIEILKLWEGIGSYQIDLNEYSKEIEVENSLKENTGKVYAALWNKYPGDMVQEAVDIIKERFVNSGVSLDIIKNKTVLDSGSGSGRYTCALSRLGAGSVVGMDWSDGGIQKGQELARKSNLTNVEFKKGSLLEMPFEDNTFDFVFSNGVCMITGDTEKATSEIYRVLKPGGKAWYFIYGSGGFYWYARKKMNKLMKRIPQRYTMMVLELIGMPMNRFIFCDNWYVPIEDHTTKDELIQMFDKIGFSSFKRASKGRKTDFDFLTENGTEQDRQMWGEGNHRYILEK